MSHLKPSSAPIGRRTFLGIAALASLVACAPDPLIHPTSTPVPVDDTHAAVASELATLAAFFHHASESPDVSDDQRSFYEAMAAMHDHHVDVMTMPNPIDSHASGERLTPTIATPMFTTVDQARAAIAERYIALRVAVAHLHSEDVSLRLLYISLDIVATAFENVTGPPPTTGDAVPHLIELDEDEQWSLTLTHMHRLVFTLQTLIGTVGERLGSDTKTWLGTLEAEASSQRERVIELMDERDIDRPAAEAVYEIPDGVREPGRARAILADVYRDVVLHLARVTALTNNPSTHEFMHTAARRLRESGGALPYWPGWS